MSDLGWKIGESNFISKRKIKCHQSECVNKKRYIINYPVPVKLPKTDGKVTILFQKLNDKVFGYLFLLLLINTN